MIRIACCLGLHRGASALAAGALALSLLAAGCEPDSECHRITARLEAGRSQLAAADRVAVADTEPAQLEPKLRQLARAATAEAAGVSQLPLTRPDLQQQVEGYGKALEALAGAAEKLAATSREAAKLLVEGAESERAYEAAIEAVAKACEGGAAGCVELATKLQAHAAPAANDAEYARRLDELARSLEALDLGEGGVLRAAVSKLTRAISKRGRLLRRLNEVRAQTSAQAATLSQDKARVDDRAAAIVRLCGRQ